MLPGTKAANEQVRRFQQGGIPALMATGETQEEWWDRKRKTPYTEKDESEWLKIKQMVLINDYKTDPKTPKYIRDNPTDFAWYEAQRQANALRKGERLIPIDVDPQGNFKKWMLTSSAGEASRRRSSGLSYQEFKAQEKKRVEDIAARKITAAVRKVAKKKSKEPRVRTNVGMEEMIKLRDDAIVAKRARLTGETKAEARKALVAMKAIYVPEPEPEPELDVAEWTLKNPVRVYYVEEARAGLSFEKRRVIDPKTEDVIGELGEAKFADLRELIRRKDDLDDEFPDLEGLEWTDVPKSQEQAQSGKCPKHPRARASSVRQTKMAMRGPNPNREGWKLPRKPYGHANEVVELEDDLTDAELKKMTSELPRRCLVEAVADWAKEHNKIVLPSITRADKAEIVATIKEHRIPVPKMSGGGYYGDDMDDILTGGQIHNEVHLCPECRMGDDEWDFIENERRTTQPYEIAGMGSAASIPRSPDMEGGKCPKTGERPCMCGGSIPTNKELYEKAKAIVYPKYKKPSAYRSGALIKKYKELGGEFKEQGERKLGRWFKEDWKDVGNQSYPVYRPTKRITKDTPLTPAEIDPDNLKLQIAEKQKIKGSKNLSPFFHMRGAASEWDWGGDEDVYYDEDGKETTKEKYDELEPILPEQPQFVGDPTQFKAMPFDPNNPMMYRGSGNNGDYLKTAKAFAKKAGYKDWNKIKYATDGVHKLELNGVKFGRKGYGDFIDYGMKDGDKEAQKHRKAYLARATNIKGSWKDDPMSKNNLAIKVLWGGAKQPALPPNIDLVSKKESPVVEEIIEEPMDDTDIRAYYPNAKIMRYSDLKNYKTITQLLPKDKSYAFLLYQQETNSGHWVLIMRYGSTIEFFCSYGSAIDAPLKWTNPRDRQLLGEAVPYLSNLLKSQKEFNVIHNPVQYQSKGTDKATCGAHDVMRLSQMLNHGQDLTDYYDFMSRIKKESGLSYDEIVANFVSQR